MTEETTETCKMDDSQDPEMEEGQELDEEMIPEAQLDAQEAENALAALKSVLMAIPAAHVRPLKVSATNAVGVGLAYPSLFIRKRKKNGNGKSTAEQDTNDAAIAPTGVEVQTEPQPAEVQLSPI